MPDTSALYANPALEEWDDGSPATLVIVPQVIRELDKHKAHHPAEDVRRKAVSLIKRLENIGQRGDTFRGVKLAGKLTLREVATDAGRDDMPPLSTTPLTDLKEGEKSRLIRVEPRYPIENKGSPGSGTSRPAYARATAASTSSTRTGLG